MTYVRKRMLEELQRRNYSESTIRGYLQAVEQFAVHFGRSPDKLGPDELRSYQAYLLKSGSWRWEAWWRTSPRSGSSCADLKRRDLREDLPYPKDRRRLPIVLSLEEVARL